MGDSVFVRFNLPDRSYQASVRAETRRIADYAGFRGHRLGEIEIIIAEITSNLVKHTDKGGYLLVRALTDELKGIEIIAIDEGPGMNVPADMMRDGKSTTKTLGQGLGAIKRLSNEFDIYSMSGWGSIILSRSFVDKDANEKTGGSFQVVGINVCKPGEQVSGDAWSFIQKGKMLRGIVVDGLGHGRDAHEAAIEAVTVFSKTLGQSPVDQLYSIHQNLKRTRGGVINIVHIDTLNNQLVYSGVGNISMKVVSYVQSKGCYSYNGIVGHIMPGVLNNHTVQWQQTDMIIIHSDGISTRWDIQKYPNILQHHPLMLCGVLYKDHNRGTDDATIVFGKMIKKLK